MGYYVKPLPNRQSLPKWKLQFISWKKSDTEGSRAKKPKKEWHIPRSRWSNLGFHTGLTLSEAKARAKQLNAKEKLKRQEECTLRLEEKEAELKLLNQAELPEEFVEEFEARFIRQKDSETLAGRRESRAQRRWRAAQKMIRSIAIEPKDWFFHQSRFYDYFFTQKLSIRYAHSILSLVNLWGFFYCRKLGHPFLEVNKPRGYERQRIVDANYEKRNRSFLGSRPLSPEELESRRNDINMNNFNWLSISVWFGLRPLEIDNLKKQNYRLQTLADKTVLLWVYQTKIISMPKELRWKPIPVLLPQQMKLLPILEQGCFKRPLNKTLKYHFDKDLTLYGGRKGFVDLMLRHGESIENISIWMGHSTINRTWKHYKQMQRFHQKTPEMTLGIEGKETSSYRAR